MVADVAVVDCWKEHALARNEVVLTTGFAGTLGAVAMAASSDVLR